MAPKTNACWIRNRNDERAIAEGCWFDVRAAERVRDFFRQFLRHSKGQWAGKAFEITGDQWENIIGPIFGWKRADGTRRFREAFIGLPKKNGKSSIAAGVGLYLLCGDNEPGAEVYSMGCDRDQASIVHGEAVRMAKASAGLASVLHTNETTKNILFERANSYYRALSGEAESKEGLNAHGLICDELHVWKGDRTYNAIRYAGRSRRQPLRFEITTAGEDKQTICGRRWDYALGVASGEIPDTRLYCYIRAAEPTDDWRDPAIWRKANPSMGVTFSEEDFAADVRQVEKSPTDLPTFQRYSLNIWTTSTQRWLRAADWAKCKRQYRPEDLAGRPCWGGLDLGQTRDMTAWVLMFPGDEPDTYRQLAWFWLPEEVANHPDSPAEYRLWAKDGWIELTPGDVTDYAFVKRRAIETSLQFDLQDYAYDPWNAEQLTQQLQEEAGLRRFSFTQTVGNFAEPTKEYERLVIAGKLHHNNNPVLNWQASHCTVRTDVNGNKRPVKPVHGSQKKIDGMVAGIQALARARIGAAGSVYDRPGGLAL